MYVLFFSSGLFCLNAAIKKKLLLCERICLKKRKDIYNSKLWLSLFVLADKQESSLQSKATVGPFGIIVSLGADFFFLTLSRSQHRFFLDLGCQCRLDSHMSCLSGLSHLPLPFLTAFWDVAGDLPQVPLPLPTWFLQGMCEQTWWIPVGPLPRRIPSYSRGTVSTAAGFVCRVIPAELCSPVPSQGWTFPPSWSQESLVAVLGQVAGLAAQWHPWVGMELLCLVLAFRAWARSLFDRSCLLELQRNANCSEIAIAMPGCAHRKHPGPGRFVGSSKSCLALRVLVEWQL